MSMIRCDDCERQIDSDFDPDCFIDTSPTTTVTRCERCRERGEIGLEHPDAGGRSYGYPKTRSAL